MSGAKVIEQSPASLSKKAKRRLTLLNFATAQINERGAESVDLAALAKESGFTRNALYYYVADRQELAFLCFERSCDLIFEDLEAAIKSSDEPTEQIQQFVSSTLAVDREAIAPISEIDFLTSSQQRTIALKRNAIANRLADQVALGIEHGVFRSVDPLLFANCLMGMLDWVRIAPRWLGQESSPAVLSKLSAAIAELLLHGIGSSSASMPEEWPDLRRMLDRSFNAFDREEAASEKRAQLLSAASQLFNRHGIAGTSISEIAASVGATKGTLYHYFEDKNAIVIACYERAFGLYRQFIETAIAAGKDGFQRSVIVHHLNCQAQAGDSPPLILQAGLNAIDEEFRATFVEQAQRLWLAVRNLVSEGQTDDSCRPGETKFITEVAAGGFAWLAKQHNVEGPKSPTEMANDVCDLIGFGIVKK